MRTELDLNECEHFLKANLDQSDIESSWIVLSENGDLISMIDLSKICAPAQVSRSNLHTYNNLTSCYRPTRSNLQQLCPSSRYQARCMRSNVFIYARHRQGVRFHLAPFRNRFQIAPLFFLFRFSTHTGIVCTLSCCLKQTLAKRPLIVKLFADQINCISSH